MGDGVPDCPWKYTPCAKAHLFPASQCLTVNGDSQVISSISLLVKHKRYPPSSGNLDSKKHRKVLLSESKAHTSYYFSSKSS